MTSSDARQSWAARRTSASSMIDRRPKRDRHALTADGMVLCNPRDKEAALRAQMEGIATDDRAAVTCRKCRALLYRHGRARKPAW
jgi:hypothetical protein